MNTKSSAAGVMSFWRVCFVREAFARGSEGGEDDPDTLGSQVKNWMEVDFWGFRINRAVLGVVEPYQKVCGDRVWKMWKYWRRRSESLFLYVENGDAVSLSCEQDRYGERPGEW